MSIAPKCDCCGDELTEPGGLMFSPPSADGGVAKYHLCGLCFGDVLDFVARGSVPLPEDTSE